MWLLRLLAVVWVIAMGVALATYAFSGKRAYLALCWRMTQFAVAFALLVFALLFVERLAVIPL